MMPATTLDATGANLSNCHDSTCAGQTAAAAIALRHCPACQRDNTDAQPLVYSRDPWRLKSCAACGFVYLENAPGYESIATDFAWTKSHAAHQEQRRREQPIISHVSSWWKQLRRRIAPRDKATALARRQIRGGRILDIGCSYGVLLSRLPDSFIPFGIELEADIARFADEDARRRGGRVVQADALRGLASFADESFDGISMIGFLEHEVQPTQVLRDCCRVLRPSGRLIIKVPNYGCWNRSLMGAAWCGFRFPDHVNYFTASSLVSMIRQCGLQTVRCDLRDRSPLSDSLWLVCARAS